MAEAKTVEDQEEDEQFVAVEDESGEGQTDDDEQDGGEDEDEDLAAAGGEDADEGDEETRLGGGREEDAEEEKRARRREENKSRRQRQKEARDLTERELKFLQNRNEELERRFSHFQQETEARVTGSEIANIDSAISKARSDLQLANTVIQQAVEQNDGKNLAEALDHRDGIRDSLRELEQSKEYLSQPRQRVQQEQAQPQLDPRHVAHAQQFMVDNDWWNPDGRDPDSQKVLELDRALVQEGYDPTHKEYWDELRTRTEEALPNRFDSRAGSRGSGKSSRSGNGKKRPAESRGPQFRTGGRERPLKKNEVYISPDRKEAMIEAGVWDDPVLRNKYLKAYAEYDQQANTGA